MRNSRLLTFLLICLFLFEMVTPWNTIYGETSISDVQQKEKVYFEWLGHNYTRNKTGSAILRVTRVDYTTGLFKHEDVELDFIDKSKEYYFRSISGLNKKKPHVSYTILKSGTTERIISYDTQKHSFAFLANQKVAGSRINEVYPDADMYVVENTKKEYLVYSLSKNKLIHKTKQIPEENWDLFYTNVIRGNDFDPDLPLSAIYVVPRIYFDTKSNSSKTYPGEFPYEIKLDGTIVKLRTYKKNNSDDFVYKKKLSNSVMFKQSKAGNLIKHELIINGKIRTLLETNLNRANYAYAIAQISPKGKYVVLKLSYFENKRIVKGKEEFQIFDAGTGKLIRKIPINTTGFPSLMDYKINWIGDTDHIIQSNVLQMGTYRTIESNIITPWRYGNVVSASRYYYTFPMDDYLSMNDPIPVSYKGKYMRYSGQGTFRTADLTTYTPVAGLMNLLGGTVVSKNGKITVTYQEESYTLDPKKQIIWNNRTYYPTREIVTAVGLKLLTKSNVQAADDWMELQIIE